MECLTLKESLVTVAASKTHPQLPQGQPNAERCPTGNKAERAVFSEPVYKWVPTGCLLSVHCGIF